MIRLFAYSPVFQIKEQNNQHQPASLAEKIIQPEQALDRGILQGFFEFAGNRCFYWQMWGCHSAGGERREWLEFEGSCPYSSESNGVKIYAENHKYPCK